MYELNESWQVEEPTLPAEQKELIQSFDANTYFSVEVVNPDNGETVYLGIYDITAGNIKEGKRKSCQTCCMPNLGMGWVKIIKFEDCESEKKCEFTTEMTIDEFMRAAYDVWSEMHN